MRCSRHDHGQRAEQRSAHRDGRDDDDHHTAHATLTIGSMAGNLGDALVDTRAGVQPDDDRVRRQWQGHTERNAFEGAVRSFEGSGSPLEQRHHENDEQSEHKTGDGSATAKSRKRDGHSGGKPAHPVAPGSSGFGGGAEAARTSANVRGGAVAWAA